MSNAQEFSPGELVDITIRARIAIRHSNTDGRRIWIEVAGGDYCLPSDDSVTVERVAPPEWPPRAGDLWRDRDGSVWFTFRDPCGWLAMQVDNPPSDWKPEPHAVLGRHGPLTLVHRKPEGGAS